jgi:hypothetical protein
LFLTLACYTATRYEENIWGLADLHIHTIYSWDATPTVRSVLERTVQHTDLDVIAITDHDVVKGALQAVDLAPHYGIEVIPGIEISTAEGHLLALFVYEAVPPGLSLTESVLRVGELGGLCVAPHPAARGVHALSSAAILHALQDPDVARILVGIEVFNAGIFRRQGNAHAEQLGRGAPVPRWPAVTHIFCKRSAKARLGSLVGHPQICMLPCGWRRHTWRVGRIHPG